MAISRIAPARPIEPSTTSARLVGSFDDSVSVTPDDLIAWCRDYLPAYMLPREVRLLHELPRTATGKADREALKRAAQCLEADV